MLDLMNPKRFSLVKNASEIFQFAIKIRYWSLIVLITPTPNGSWAVEAFSLCFTSTQSPRGPSWNEGHWPKVRHETSVLEVPAQEQHKHSFTLVLLIRLLHVLCTQYAGIAHHQALQTSGRGWADSKAVHGMECSGARSLYWRSLTAGAAT